MQGPPQLSQEQHPIKDLERLVETEARLDEVLRAARAEAGGLVAQARDRVARAEERWAAEYEAARRELERRVAEECDCELARIREEADRLTAGYAAQSVEQVDALATWVADQLRGPAARRDVP